MPIHVAIIHRNLRWEVSTDGVTRPLVDWSYSKERAIELAIARAREVGARYVAVERWDGTVDEWIALDGSRTSRLPRVA